MTLRPWKKLTESIVFKNPYWTYKRDTLELPGGRPGELETQIRTGVIWDGMTIAAWSIAKAGL